MPLPENGTPWPPAPLAKITGKLNEWDAWYTGDPVKLASRYGYLGAGRPGYPVPRTSQYATGIIGNIARWFWGQPQSNQQLTKLHVPLAADICQAGADLLFSEPPTFTVEEPAKNKATQDRLGEILDETAHSVFAEAAEIGGALGGAYLKVTWDRALTGKPFLTVKHADAAWPEFRWDRLVAVTFWTRVRTDGQRVWRLLERHELDTQGVGVILYGLYEGSEGNLGKAVPLTEDPTSAPLAQPGVLRTDSTISTESPGLGVVYIPNQRPQRLWRNDPVGAQLGRSDIDGVEHLMDSLDEVYSSWMRDIRIGKGRVFVARSMLDDQGAGNGATFDADREIFAPLEMLMSPNQQGSGLPIQAEQFKIRYEEHGSTAAQLVTDILRTAGYSSQTFGMADGGRQSDQTATEVQARERRSYLTRDRKIRLQRPQLAAIAHKLLLVDKAVFNSAVNVDLVPSVAFADAVQESQITLAQTASALRTAEAASTETLVALVHPDWDDETIATEVGKISAERSASQPSFADPFGAVPAIGSQGEPGQ